MKFRYYAAALMISAAAPAMATGISLTPGTLTPSSNDGAVLLDDFSSSAPASSHNFYSAPVSVSLSETSGSGLSSATSSGSLTIANAPTPGITSSGSIATNGLSTGSVSVQGTSHYSFQILGAPGTALVTINATGAVGFSPASLFPSGFAETSARFRVEEQFSGPIIVDEFLDMTNAVGGGFVDQSDPSVLAPTPSISFTVAGNFTLWTNTVYDVLLGTSFGGSASTGPGGGVSDSMFANIDPTFTVNGPYTFEVSPGFGGFTVADGVADGGSGVPEPASLALLGAGLAGLAFMRRRRAA